MSCPSLPMVVVGSSLCLYPFRLEGLEAQPLYLYLSLSLFPWEGVVVLLYLYFYLFLYLYIARESLPLDWVVGYLRYLYLHIALESAHTEHWVVGHLR